MVSACLAFRGYKADSTKPSSIRHFLSLRLGFFVSSSTFSAVEILGAPVEIL